MCNTDKRHAGAIQDRLDNIRRPMRYGSAKTEPIARKAFAGIGREWLKFIDTVARSLPNGKGLQFEDKESHNFSETKDFNPDELKEIDDSFARYAGKDALKAFDAAADEFVESTVGKNGKAQISTDPAILDAMYFAAVSAAGVAATAMTKTSWDKMSNSWKKRNPWTGGPYVYDPALGWVRKLYKDGFKLVKDNTTKLLAPTIKQDIVTMVQQNTPWNTISRTLRNKYGDGKLWFWQRLVRTEMVIAITKTATERYAQLGVSYLKWSLGNNACPVCTGFRNTVNMIDTGDPDRGVIALTGVWVLGTEPGIPSVTHPNCRCLWLPLFRV